MLSNTLNTNEVKNAAGTEVEFQRLSQGEGRKTVFAQIAETPNAPYRLSVSHLETGSGINLRRRSLVRFDKTVVSTVDASKMVNIAAYTVLDAPVGALTATAEMANVIANLNSFMASLGATTTILYDGTGNGAATLLSGQF
jgi:hypothetical protein